MKTLASCSPKEFLIQTNKIRRYAEKWLDDTKILEIRQRIPEYTVDMTAEERKEITKKQVKENVTAILDAVLEDYPEETAVLLGLLCFVEPEDIDNHSMTEFFSAITEIIQSPEVIGFFTSFMQLGRVNISGSARV